jgi:hypothetical protein
MSEPTGGANETPDPDQDQDQTSGSVFSDPTAPVWADPTAPVPTPPAPEAPPGWAQDAPPGPPVRPAAPAPQGAEYPYGQQSAAPQEPPPAPPMSNPYAQRPPVQRPPVQQYGQQVPAYGQQPTVQQYGQQAPAYGQQPPGFGQQPYQTGAPTTQNVSAIVLMILSVLSLCNVVAFGSLVLGIVALTKQSADPEGSRHLTKIGWIVFAVSWAVAILAVIGLVILGINSPDTSRSNFDTSF